MKHCKGFEKILCFYFSSYYKFRFFISSFDSDKQLHRCNSVHENRRRRRLHATHFVLNDLQTYMTANRLQAVQETVIIIDKK